MDNRPSFRQYLFSTLFLMLIGWGGLSLLIFVIDEPPFVWARWGFFALWFIALTGVALPIVYFLNLRFPSRPPAEANAIVRQALWVGFYGATLAWFQLGHLMTLWVWMGLGGGLIAIESLIRWRERARRARHLPMANYQVLTPMSSLPIPDSRIPFPESRFHSHSRLPIPGLPSPSPMTNLQTLPSVEKLLQTPRAADLMARYGRPLTLDAFRSTLDEVRSRLKLDPQATPPENDLILSQAASRLSAWIAPTLQAVINATGVILHTNLGRAPLSKAAIEAMDEVSLGYSNLEFDLETGKRGSRLLHAEAVLRKLLGVEAAVVVNNNASAVLLVLSALASRKRVIIARSQLVEIGGGFRMPDVMKQSGAKLVEVGTTNKVRLSDYKKRWKKQGLGDACPSLELQVGRLYRRT